MAYGIIVPGFWDHEQLAECSLGARLVAAFLLTAREAQLVPGLINLGVAGLSEAARIPADVVTSALDELSMIGFLEVDEKRRLIRIPNAPRYNRASNPNMVRGWFRRWQMLPKCELRDRHVASLKLGCADTEAFQNAWSETFGSVELNPCETVTQTLSKPFEKGYPNRFERDGVGVRSYPDPDPEGPQAAAAPDAPALALVPVEPSRPDWGLEVYALYPRKEGKTPGLKRLRPQLKSAADAELCKLAAKNYAERVAAEGREIKHVKLFSTWVGEWRDWVNPEQPLLTQPRASPSQGRFDVAPDFSSVRTPWKAIP